MALILNGKSWQDKDGVLSPITLGTLTGAFGEERVLTLDYSFDQSLNDCEIYFNPALFIEQGITLEQTQTLPPATAYWYKVTAATVAGVQQTMNLLNSNATERNMSVTFALNADRLSFKIRLTCFLTADILSFLSDDGIDNSIRLLSNTKDSGELDNDDDSVYNLNVTKGFGIHTGIKVPAISKLCGVKGKAGVDGIQQDSYIADGELFVIRFNAQTIIDKLEIFVNGVLTASSGKNAGNNFGGVDGFDGNAGLGYALGSHPNPPVVPGPNLWYIGGATTFNNRLADFLADTGITASLGGYQQIIWVNTEAGDNIVVRVAGTGGTAWSYEIYCPQSTTTIPSKYEYSDAWISANFIFLNEGLMTNPVFELSRNSIVETEFATFADTNVKLQIDYASPKPVSKAKVWIIDADNTTQALDFKKSYGYQPNNYFNVPNPVNVGGITWETNFVIDKAKLNIAGRYFIIAVYYDSTNQYVASYISDAIFVTNVQFLTPTTTGTIYNLVANFASNYIEVSPLQRICCEITLTKYTGFNAAYLGGNVKIGGETFTFLGKNNQGNFENTNRFVFSDSAGTLIIRFYLRVKEEWQNTEIDILWNINFNVEYTTITFPQRIAVSQMEQNKAIPNLTEIKLYRDGVLLLEDGDTACDSNFLRVETIKDASAINYAQAAIWKDDAGNVYEEEAWSPISVFTQSTNAFQSNVEIYFGDSGSVDNITHDITNIVDNGEVGMVGYPPPIPSNFIRHAFHNTIYTGRNVVFIAEYDYGSGKSFAAINGVTSADFLFRIGSPSTSTDANDGSWAAFSDLSFAAFAAATIPINSRVMVRYVGAATQTDIVGYLEMAISATPVNPKSISIPILKDIAVGDIAWFTGLNTNFTGVTYTGGGANSFSAKRTFLEVANSEDLVTYSTGLASANSPNKTLVPHLYFEKTTNTDITLNISLNQIENPNIEIGNPALGLRNKFYPVTGNGVNPPAIVNDLINDVYEVESLDVRQFHAWNLRPVGSVLTYFATCRLKNTFDAIISQSTNGFNGVLIFNGQLFYNLESISTAQDTSKYADAATVNNGVYTFVVEVTKGAEVGTLPNLWSVRFWINGRRSADLPFQNTPYVAGIPWQDQNLHLFSSGDYYGNQPTSAGRNAGLMNRAVTDEEVRRYAMGNEDILRTGCQHAWIFDTLNTTPLNPSWRVVPNVGLLGDANNGCLVKNTTNPLGTLFT